MAALSLADGLFLSYDELTKAALGLRDTFEERQPRHPDFPRVILTRFVANTLRSGVLLHHPDSFPDSRLPVHFAPDESP